MKNKIFFIIQHFGYFILSTLCFIIGELTIKLKYVDTSFIKDLTNDELSIIVYSILGMWFVFMGMVDMIIYLIKKGDDKL